MIKASLRFLNRTDCLSLIAWSSANEIVLVTRAIVYYILSWDEVERQLYQPDEKIDCSQFEFDCP